MQEKRTFLNFHLRYVLVRGNFDAPEGGERKREKKNISLVVSLFFISPPKLWTRQLSISRFRQFRVVSIDRVWLTETTTREAQYTFRTTVSLSFATGRNKKTTKKYLPITNKRACPNAILLPFNVEEYARLTKNLWTVHYEVNTVNPCFLRWLPSFTLSKESLRLIVKPAISLVARPSCSPPNRKIRAFYDPRNLVYHRTAPSSTYDAVTCRFAARCNFSSREIWSLHDILQTVF